MPPDSYSKYLQKVNTKYPQISDEKKKLKNDFEGTKVVYQRIKPFFSSDICPLPCTLKVPVESIF